MHERTTSAGDRYVSARQVLIVWARTAVTPTVLRNVVFTDMLEPVMMVPRRPSIAMLFGTASGINGCLMAVMTDDVPGSVNCGRVHPLMLDRYDATLTAESTSPTA